MSSICSEDCDKVTRNSGLYVVVASAGLILPETSDDPGGCFTQLGDLEPGTELANISNAMFIFSPASKLPDRERSHGLKNRKRLLKTHRQDMTACCVEHQKCVTTGEWCSPDICLCPYPIARNIQKLLL